jgi:hypothetical protein
VWTLHYVYYVQPSNPQRKKTRMCSIWRLWRVTVLACGFISMICGAVPTQAASLTYRFVNDTIDQDGYSLSGTITTDGTLGALKVIDIKAWSFSIDQGNTVIASLSSKDAGAYIGSYFPAFTVTASAANLTVVPGGLLFADNLNETSLAFRPLYKTYAATDASGTTLWNDVPPSEYTGSDWIFATATVPEPSTMVLFSIAAVVGLGAWAQRRRSA